MTKMIDVQGMPEKDVELIEHIVERLRTKAKRKSESRLGEDAEIAFAGRPHGPKGNLAEEKTSISF